MKKTIRTSIFIAFLTTLVIQTNAQDALYSQFNYAPTYLNPGMAGTGKNNLRLSALSKVQWFNLYKPYKYLFGGLDYSIYDDFNRNVLNLGLNVNHSEKGYLGNTNISGIVGRSFGTNKMDCSSWFLSIALQAGYNFAKVNPNEFVFSDQLDQTGITGIPSTVDLFKTYNTKNYFDFSSGFVFTFKDFMIGASAHHMNEPNTSFNGKPEDGRLPKKITGHLSYRLETDVITLKPTVITQFQGKSSVFTAGALIDYYEFPIEMGLWYRNAVGMANNNAFCVGLTWKWGEATTVTSKKREYSSKIGLNYDADISRPGIIATHGSMEFGIQKDIITNKDKTCPTSLTGQCDYRFPWEFL
jgi:type IX secretion system PorP/SprF family membrane protein